MKRPSDIDRRTYLRGISTAALFAGGVSATAGAAGGQIERGVSTQQDGPPNGPPEHRDGIPASHPFVGDLDEDIAFNVMNRYGGDPAVPRGDADPGDRDWVLHYTTDSQESRDYPAAMVNLRQRLESPVSLADVQGDGTLTVDFFVGKQHDQYTPGQVYLILQTPEQQKKDEKKGEHRAWGLYKNVRHDVRQGVWHILDVVEEMAGARKTGDPWRALELDIDPEGFRGSFDTFSDAILQQAMDTRDEMGEQFTDLFELPADSNLLAVGLGSGSSRSPSKRDIYYDDLRISVPRDGGLEEYTFELPAVLQMDADFDGRGRQIAAELSFPHPQEDVDLNRLNEESVRLYPLSQIMPPLDPGVEATRVDVAADRIDVQFAPGQVRGLDRLGGGEQYVVVAGQFDYEHVVWFFALGRVTVPGN